MSPESIRHRAFGAKNLLTDAELRYLTELDFVEHVALAAVARGETQEVILAVGRYCCAARSRDGCRRAELAIAVADEHQGRGIGTLLLEHLAHVARSAGIEELEAGVLADNAKMMDVFARSGLAVEKSMDAGVYHVRFPTSETEAFLCASAARERHAAAQSVRVFLEPASVAVVGASRREGSIGRAILENLERCGYSGPIFPINPHAQNIDGRQAFATIGAVPGKIDLAVVVVPAAAVEQVLLDCARAHVRGVVVISSGFAEVGQSGREAQQKLRARVRSSGMRMVGPNCMGVLNASPSVSLNATFAPTWPPAGGVSMISQSGALGIAMLDYAARLNIGLAGFVSVGNKADVSSNDLISYWANDDVTKVIALYLESFGNPRKFSRIAPEVARKKPIVAMKSGRSAAGTRAAASHSAALASLDVCVDALFSQAGVIRTNTLEELFDVVALLSTEPLPAGPRVGIVTNAGGPGILLADACDARGLVLPELARETLDVLRGFLPKEAGLSNPIDMTAAATAEQYARAAEVVGNDPNIDSLVVIYIPPLITKPEEVAAAIANGAGRVPREKPIATVFMSSKGAPPILSTGPRGKLPSYSFPENAALALAEAVSYARWRDKPRGKIATLNREQRRSIRQIVERLVVSSSSTPWVPVRDLARILELASIHLAAFEEIRPDPESAVAAARSIGYPVVAKAVARGLVHKSDVGGVILGLEGDAAVRNAVDMLVSRVRSAGHELEGVIVQHHVKDGVEAIVGVTIDPSFGPLLVAGLGGVQVELLRDVAFRLTPVSDVDATEMLCSLRSAKLLDGFRGAPPADRVALLSLIESVSALVEIVPELLELELNPVEVLPRGRGAVAVDARMRLTTR
jgi:acetyl coenzyme A synthetase (ADP forming)-like protein